MPQGINWQDIQQAILSMGKVDPARMAEQIRTLVLRPTSNLTAALVLLAAVTVVGVIVLLLIIAAITGRASRERQLREIEEIETLQYYLAVIDADESGSSDTGTGKLLPPHAEPQRRPVSWVSLLVGLSIVVAVAAVTWVALGATTGSQEVCAACHVETIHSKAANARIADAHSSVECVRCHESGGWLSSVTVGVPGRFAHFANGVTKTASAGQYGGVTSSACLSCHQTVAQKVTVDEKRGVRMSHAQPLAAGARCLDCHTASTGVVSSLTVGMAPCLRCHDGKKQPAECSFCHTKDVSASTASHASPADLPGRTLIPTPNCGACHDQAKTCDPCHGGVRMPHSTLFKTWGHARKGVEDIWYNNGQACARCHTPERRPCTKCHVMFPGHPVPVWETAHQASDPNACAGCHNAKAWVTGRDFCALCHGPVKVTQ